MAVNIHTHAAAPGEQLRVRAQGSHLSRGIEGGESAGHSLPPPTQCQTQDSNPQLSGYKADSLTIRPRLPQMIVIVIVIYLIVI